MKKNNQLNSLLGLMALLLSPAAFAAPSVHGTFQWTAKGTADIVLTETLEFSDQTVRMSASDLTYSCLGWIETNAQHHVKVEYKNSPCHNFIATLPFTADELNSMKINEERVIQIDTGRFYHQPIKASFVRLK